MSVPSSPNLTHHHHLQPHLLFRSCFDLPPLPAPKRNTDTALAALCVMTAANKGSLVCVLQRPLVFRFPSADPDVMVPPNANGDPGRVPALQIMDDTRPTDPGKSPWPFSFQQLSQVNSEEVPASRLGFVLDFLPRTRLKERWGQGFKSSPRSLQVRAVLCGCFSVLVKQWLIGPCVAMATVRLSERIF